MQNGIAVGLVAGIVSALMLIGATMGSVAGLFASIFIAPLPIIITGLGWGWGPALLAAISAAVLMAAMLEPGAAIFHLAAISLPMVVCSYLLMLNRDSNVRGIDGSVVTEWYPPGRVLAVLALLVCGILALSLFSIADNENQIETVFQRYIERFDVELPAGTNAETFAKQTIKTVMPAAVMIAAWFWMFVACVNLWLGGLVTHKSGLLARPWPDLSLMTLPHQTPIALLAAIALSFAPGYPGLFALSFASAIFFAYMIIGLAIIHNITRALRLRSVILCAVYLSLIILFPLSMIVAAMIGIAEPVSPLRRSCGSAARHDDT